VPDTEPPRGRAKLAALREEYTLGGLDETDLERDPHDLLHRWMDEAIAGGLYDPTAMVVSTVSGTGRPSSRMVLLKGLDERGLVFYTNYSSRKGEELAGRQECSVVFPWHALQRQVRVEGAAVRLSDEENDAYFASRPRDSQIGAWASPQSQVVTSREELDRRYAEATARFVGGPVPRPPYWGGFLITPDAFEFWQGRRGRMHDRFRYLRLPSGPDVTPGGGSWQVQRLAP
jgi:pyridoxamine 5'-phosphate oxidase